MIFQEPMPYLMRAAPKTSTSSVVQPGDKEKFHRDLLSELCFIEIVVDAMVSVWRWEGFCVWKRRWKRSRGRGGTGKRYFAAKVNFRFRIFGYLVPQYLVPVHILAYTVHVMYQVYLVHSTRYVVLRYPSSEHYTLTN